MITSAEMPSERNILNNLQQSRLTRAYCDATFRQLSKQFTPQHCPKSFHICVAPFLARQPFLAQFAYAEFIFVLHVIHRINSDYFPKQRCLLWDRNGF
jgi:hypothetical protein